jgi:hypothetical protein
MISRSKGYDRGRATRLDFDGPDQNTLFNETVHDVDRQSQDPWSLSSGRVGKWCFNVSHSLEIYGLQLITLSSNRSR